MLIRIQDLFRKHEVRRDFFGSTHSMITVLAVIGTRVRGTSAQILYVNSKGKSQSYQGGNPLPRTILNTSGGGRSALPRPLVADGMVRVVNQMQTLVAASDSVMRPGARAPYSAERFEEVRKGVNRLAVNRLSASTGQFHIHRDTQCDTPNACCAFGVNVKSNSLWSEVGCLDHCYGERDVIVTWGSHAHTPRPTHPAVGGKKCFRASFSFFTGTTST